MQSALGVDFLVETVSSDAESVVAGWLIELDEHRVSTAVGESNCLERLSGREQGTSI